ncbi:hypothetical protein BYT27DRAFT_7237241 [Phlegmacium glaucopus]|nr:hypothetical protein BYT27DRAFT_7237241 [Phlegmacium glaucopus]
MDKAPELLNDNDGVFVESEWIKVGKIYGAPGFPDFVCAEKLARLAIPDEFIQLVKLKQDISVTQFVTHELPRVSSEFITTKTDKWFSNDTPTENYTNLLTRPAPSREFLEVLDKVIGQSWLDGAKSIVDPRFNDGGDRLPLWAVTFWKDVVVLNEKQKLWRQSIKWLDLEEGKARKEKNSKVLELVEEACHVLDHLPWDAKMKYCNQQTLTSQLSRFLGTFWLSDDHIQMMIEELNCDLNTKPQLSKTITIASVYFSVSINNVQNNINLPSQSRMKTMLGGYETRVKQGGLEKLYFPLNVNGNHWIAGLVDFKKRIVVFGGGAPAKFLKKLQIWFKFAFGKSFKNYGNYLPHAVQDDSYSCSIITSNTITHSVFKSVLWNQGLAVNERMRWFIHFSTPISPKIANLLNPSSPPSKTQGYDSDTSRSSNTYSSTAGATSDTASISTSASYPESIGSDSGITRQSSSLSNKLQNYFSTWKRAHSDSGEGSTGSSDDTSAGDELTEDEHPKKYIKIGEGTSRSAVASRERRRKLFNGTFKVDERRYRTWQEKVLEDDSEAEFVETDIRIAIHSACRKEVKMKDPFDITRWRDHMGRCKAKGKTRSLFKMPGWGRKKTNSQTSVDSIEMDLSGDETPAPKKSNAKVTCPGLTEVDNPQIVQYLQRTGVLGGGARSLSAIAKEIYNKLFSKLTKEATRKRVVDTQQHEWQWRNDHANLRVFSTSCQRLVANSAPKRLTPCSDCYNILRSKAFKNAIAKPTPDKKNYIYINHRYRNRLLGGIYAREIGVQEIVESEDARSSPYVRYAQGALSGKYNNNVFNGLLQAMVSKYDREERGVGLQNFGYAPAWEELCHILRIQSPRAYNSLKEYLPMPSERNLRKREARQPRFPMDISFPICDQTFELVAEHLKTIGYNGPLGLSCDDTKLFSTFRLYWDSNEQSYFLVGGVDGPLRVADADNVKEAISQAKAQKATKVRVWCLTIPTPKVSPIIVAALPIGNTMTAPTLLILLMKVIDGLLDRGMSIVSYASDGTEVERAVQRLFLEKADTTVYIIKNPRTGCADTRIMFGIYRGQAICMIQDSKHALKTFRNNLFSGARLLTFGNHTSIYQHILEVAGGEGSPLFSRDVTKLDRQDDNAAVRLFSADVLQYLANHHPDYVGEIVYLFVFGELVDAYQNRSITHLERLKMVLRARYFLDSWETYLVACGYRKDHYFLSREAVDITRIIIEGFIALVIIHRDHIPGPTALLPWLHSSEACEHVFGEARHIVKDFTFLDFIYMIPKLRIKLHHSALRGKSSDPKARAAGYSHTYFDHEGLDLLTLSTYPTDSEIQSLAQDAAQEANISVDTLHRNHNQNLPWLPSIDSWASKTSDSDGSDELSLNSALESGDDEESEAQKLQDILNQEEDSPISRSNRIDTICLNLTSAALAVSADDAAQLSSQMFAEHDDSEIMEDVISDEYMRTQQFLNSFNTLPAVQALDAPTRPLGYGTLTHDDLTFEMLINTRRQHQTKQATSGVRTHLSRTTCDDKSTSLRRQIIQQLHDALKQAQDDVALGTGTERRERWTAPAPGGRGDLPLPVAGNSANAVLSAEAVSRKAATRRKQIFTKVAVPHLADITEARVTQLRPLQEGDLGFILMEKGVTVGRVIAIYAKTGGKNGKHAAVSESSSISAVSYLGLQVFEFMYARQFRSVCEATSMFQTKQYLLAPSTQFLCLLDSKISEHQAQGLSIELTQRDLSYFRDLQKGETQFKAAIKLFRKRGVNLEGDD